MLSTQKQIPLKGCQQLQTYLVITEQPKLELSGNCFSLACPNCPIYGGPGWNWDAEMLKRRAAILPCAAARWFFFLLLNLFDCQPLTAEQSDLLTVGCFGDVVCKAMQSACLPQFQIISNMVLVKNTKCCSHVSSGVSPTYGLFL